MQDNLERAAWIEPKIETLDVEETNAAPGRGRDGGVITVDCTRS